MKILDVVLLLLSVVNAQKGLSTNGTASQSTDYYWIDRDIYLTADLAISGTTEDTFAGEACSETLFNPTQYKAWWMLTFPVDTVYIRNVQIYYRGNTPTRLAGYYLYISNSSTSKTDGHLCYHDEGPGLPSVYQDVDCNQLGKHVIFYNERDEAGNNPAGYTYFAIIELCKVIINGCYKGWWDSTCSKPCPVNCIDDHCYPGNGSCVWGCNQDNCLYDICNNTTGKCTQGCKIGLRGDYCDKACSSGTFGNQCSSICHCVNQACNPINGTCPSGGCQHGYKGDTCSTECSLGHYGYNCNQSCEGCLSDSCDKEQGVCADTTGCKLGWQYGQPWKCDKVCESRTFGNNCSENCYCVSQQPCNTANGVCPIGGCERGYKGITCSTECSSGHYGYNCDKSCDGCLSDSCDKEYGICTNTTGCKPARLPGGMPGRLKCDKDCDDGYFGDGCLLRCYCLSEVCDKISGICPNKLCLPGWKGDSCSEECSRGFYGFNCANICNTCNITLCERFEGNCTYGCMEGYTGHQCLFSGKSQSDGQTANFNTTNMIYAVIGTCIVTTLMCVIIVLVILRYKLGIKCRDTKKQNEQSTRIYVNDAFTNDGANIGHNNEESHYEETIPSAQEQTYDTIKPE